jgi:hypothetical protein
MPPISQRGSGGSGAGSPPAAQTIAPGEFSSSARTITAPHVVAARGKDLEAARPTAAESGTLTEAIDAPGEEPPESDSELGALLAAIAEDVQESAAGARDGIMADFGARIAYAQKHLPRHLRAAAVGALKEARKAALALVSRNAAQELAGRKKAAIASRGRRPRAGKGGRKPWNLTPRRH